MTNLEVFQLSAKALGHELCIDESHKCFYRDGTISSWFEWNPFTDDSQRWECVKKLLETGWVVMGNQECNYDQMPASFKRMVYHCTPDEFPARALAELESRKEPK